MSPLWVWIAFFISMLIGFKRNNNQQSPYQPPNFVFPIVWTILYFILLYTMVTMKSERYNRLLFVAFVLQSFWLFSFNQGMLNLSSLILVLLVINAYMLYQNSNKFVLLYLGWTIFALFLNLTIKKNSELKNESLTTF